MSDNVTITQGTGKTIAADDIAGVMYQRVKVAYGDDGAATDASVNAPFPVVEKNATGTSVATLTAVASLATSQQILAANTARRGVYLHNTDANAVLVKFGTTASASSFSFRLPTNSYWEMPFPMYLGRIDAIWEADGAGSLYVTELI